MRRTNLEQSGCIADNVGELEDVGSELLLHIAQEKHCILGGEPANVCHYKSKVTEGIQVDLIPSCTIIREM